MPAFIRSDGEKKYSTPSPSLSEAQTSIVIAGLMEFGRQLLQFNRRELGADAETAAQKFRARFEHSMKGAEIEGVGDTARELEVINAILCALDYIYKT